jgi:restriction system protein
MLRALERTAEVSIRDLAEVLSRDMGLSEADLAELIPSGTQQLFYNRVGWARTYLKKAGLVDSPQRAKVRLSDLGRDVLKSAPARVDVDFLSKFHSFVEFRSARPGGNGEMKLIDDQATPDVSLKTPDEQLSEAHAQLRAQVIDELRQRVASASPSFFEDLVVKLLVAMGYGGNFKDASQRVGRSGDGGIDGIVKEDRLGLDVIYVQAKRWQGVVGRPEIQKFAGALLGQKARKGVFITTSEFSRDALDYAASLDAKIVLIDGRQLAEYMVEARVGVAVRQVYETFRVDEDFFGDEG